MFDCQSVHPIYQVNVGVSLNQMYHYALFRLQLLEHLG